MTPVLRFYHRSKYGRRAFAFVLNAERHRQEVTVWLNQHAGPENTTWWFGANGAVYLRDEDLAFAARMRWC